MRHNWQILWQLFLTTYLTFHQVSDTAWKDLTKSLSHLPSSSSFEVLLHALDFHIFTVPSRRNIGEKNENAKTDLFFKYEFQKTLYFLTHVLWSSSYNSKVFTLSENKNLPLQGSHVFKRFINFSKVNRLGKAKNCITELF